MQTMTLTLPSRSWFQPRWLVALVLACAAALALAAHAHAAEPAPAASCLIVGPNHRQCELWAKTGTLTLPGGGTVTVWGYADTAGGPAQVPGPSLIVNQGETVDVILHNTLGEVSSLALHGQGLRMDMVGAAPAGDKTYTFVAAGAGTFLYEAGLTPGGAKQVAMGLYGALIVQPVPAATAYDDEVVLILSEIDPALNANPGAFDMLNYAPKYWLINGQGHPDTGTVPVAAGQRVLVRYLNAGLLDHSPALLGLDQMVTAKDGFARPQFRAVAETVAAGQTLDTLITVPATVGALIPLSDGNRHVDNNGASFGGMLTFFEVVAAPLAPPPPPPDSAGPTTTTAVAAPNPWDGASDVALAATVDDAATGNSTITAVEYFLDAAGADGTGVAMTLATGAGTPTTDASATLASADVNLPNVGDSRTVLIHGQDAAGNWGPFATVILAR